MKPLTEKILKSGLIDKHTAELMEKYGLLDSGASDKVNEDALKNATREQLMQLADELSDEADRSDVLRETALDLERLRWPALIRIYTPMKGELTSVSLPVVVPRKVVAGDVNAVMDRVGRYYFRIQDVRKDWFVPGYVFERTTPSELTKEKVLEEVLEVQPLCIGEEVVCYQVTTRKLG
jgi:hypothetical protein